MAVAIVFVVVVLVLALRATKMIRADERAVVYRLGRILPGSRGPGLVLVAPIIDRVVRVTTNEQKTALKDVSVVTSDNAAMHVDATVEFRVTDPARALAETADYREALGKLAESALRAAAGEMTLNEILAERATLSRRVQSQLATKAGAWGLQIGDVVLENLDAPGEVMQRLQDQARADGQRRQRILENESGD
jgi:regulator of protease activity HflC (stomatin/prohibitin superfamily)